MATVGTTALPFSTLDRHQRRTLRRFAKRAAIIVGGLWLAWTVIANTASDTLSEGDPDMALSWSENEKALVNLADQNLHPLEAPRDRSLAEALAERALAKSPLESEALRILGVAADTGGDTGRGERLLEFARGLSRRDPLVNAWWFYRLSREARFAEALDFADALLRTRPNRRDSIAPTLLAYALDASALPALTERLAGNPPWRGWYLGEIGRQTANPGVAFALFNALKKAGSPPSTAELRPHLDALIGAGLFEQAYLTWIHHLPPERQNRVSFAYNGDFEQAVSGLPFDWTIRSVAGADTKLLPGESGTVVEVEFSGRRVAYQHLTKLMMLPPGSFRLSVSARAEGLQSERGLVWRIACAEGDKQQLGATPAISGSFGWRKFEAVFDVPQEKCRAQWLTLALDARAALEQVVSGRAWFDDVEVNRAGGGQASLQATQAVR